jgi:hypothetical protein
LQAAFINTHGFLKKEDSLMRVSRFRAKAFLLGSGGKGLTATVPGIFRDAAITPRSLTEAI